MELLNYLRDRMESDPLGYGFSVGICAGLIIGVLVISVLIWIESSKSKKNKKVLKATDLIGEEVEYCIKSISFKGQVVSVDYDLMEDGELQTTVYIEVDGLESYYPVDYGKNGKYIKIKGQEENHYEQKG